MDCAMQVIVLDKLDYCATTRNLSSVWDRPNFKVRDLTPSSSLKIRCLNVLSSGFLTRKSPGSNDACLRQVQFVKGDIQSADLVRHLLVTEEVDTIMHFAAQVWLYLLSEFQHLALVMPVIGRALYHFESTGLKRLPNSPSMLRSCRSPCLRCRRKEANSDSGILDLT